MRVPCDHITHMCVISFSTKIHLLPKRSRDGFYHLSVQRVESVSVQSIHIQKHIDALVLAETVERKRKRKGSWVKGEAISGLLIYYNIADRRGPLHTSVFVCIFLELSTTRVLVMITNNDNIDINKCLDEFVPVKRSNCVCTRHHSICTHRWNTTFGTGKCRDISTIQAVTHVQTYSFEFMMYMSMLTTTCM